MEVDVTPVVKTADHLLKRNNIVANNLANATTTGFKRDASFLDFLPKDINRTAGSRQYTNFSTGVQKVTDNKLDFSISGPGFFTTDMGNDVIYTRNGRFNVDASGILRAPNGGALIGEKGHIQLISDAGTPGDVSVTSDGEVYLNDEFVDKMLIVDFVDRDLLQKRGATGYSPQLGMPAQAVEQPNIKQGFIEESNVDSVNEMVELVEIQRHFESIQKVLQTIDSIEEKAANTLPRLQ